MRLQMAASVAGASMMLLLCPVNAEARRAASMIEICEGGAAGAIPPSSPCVYDSNGTLLGVITPPGYLAREISHVWYQVAILRSGIEPSGLLYYQSQDCSGQAFVEDLGQLPTPAVYDGSSFWAMAPGSTPAVFQWHSYRYINSPTGPACQHADSCGHSGNPCEETGGPASIVETRQFSPPFSDH